MRTVIAAAGAWLTRAGHIPSVSSTPPASDQQLPTIHQQWTARQQTKWKGSLVDNIDVVGGYLMLMSEKSPQCILTCSACPGSRGVGGREAAAGCWCEETNLVHYSASHFIVGEQSISLSPDTDNI